MSRVLDLLRFQQGDRIVHRALCDFTGFFGIVENLVVKDRVVEGEAETDWVGMIEVGGELCGLTVEPLCGVGGLLAGVVFSDLCYVAVVVSLPINYRNKTRRSTRREVGASSFCCNVNYLRRRIKSQLRSQTTIAAKEVTEKQNIQKKTYIL